MDTILLFNVGRITTITTRKQTIQMNSTNTDGPITYTIHIE